MSRELATVHNNRTKKKESIHSPLSHAVSKFGQSWQTPDTQNVPLHSAILPHLHIPDSQVSDVELGHIGRMPHIQMLDAQVSDNPKQSSFPEQVALHSSSMHCSASEQASTVSAHLHWLLPKSQ